jgi:fructoselysine 6-phosphate deglycase
MKDLLIKPDLNVAAVQAALADTVAQLPDVAAYGAEVSKGIKRVYMVSCGGGLHIDNGIQWWCDVLFETMGNVRYKTYDAADFLSLPMADTAGPETLVMLTSKSGSTKEVLAVGARIQKANKGCKVVCFTKAEQAMIVKYGIKSIYTGDGPQSFHAMLMLHHAFIGGIWAAREKWAQLDELLASLKALPAVLAKAALASQARGKEFAANFDSTGTTYFIGAGPMQFVGKAFGNCLLEEMLELCINVFPANHFYHSLVEKMPLKDADRVILLLGLDSARWQVEQVQKWYADHELDVDVYDARDYDMNGIHELIRPMFAAIVDEAALKAMVGPMSHKIKEDLDKRKYMGKENFWEGSKVVTEMLAFLKVN